MGLTVCGSTVSKVLRQKEKFFYPDDGSRSPIKRSKGKFPDIERALSNWARNHQKQGFALSDNAIREKARFFATTVGNSESHHKVNSNSWLEKFKQKNNLLGAKPRKGSTDATATDSDGVANADSSTTSSCHTPNRTTPVSPSGATSPSPMSPTRSQDSFKNESPSDRFLNFSYRHGHSQSATSLHSFSDTTAPPLSGGATSPTEPYLSSDLSNGIDPIQTVIKRNHSNPDIKTSMQPPPLPRSNSATVSPTTSSPGSPTPDEARKALETVIIYFKNQPMGLVDPQEYIAIGKLMEKLKLIHTPGIPLPGGLHRIEEDEATETHVRKKRNIHNVPSSTWHINSSDMNGISARSAKHRR
jgi:Tc5 transposase DNA-binding domain